MPPERLYFGYGSNLWKAQMLLRCPTSKYIGIARLAKYRWIINSRGYANVVETDDVSDVVYGLIYALQQADEDKLDVNEGVPVAYTKEDPQVELWRPCEGSTALNVKDNPERTKVLVYINRDLTTPAKSKKEYIFRMNKGIEDALAAGVPMSYIDDVLRKFIPARDTHDETVAALAEKQALRFEEES